MLVSLLITLLAQNSGKLGGFFGREIQAWFLSQLARHEPSLAESIHSSERIKPYTVSSLIKPQTFSRVADNPNNEYWLRITTLTESIGTVLLEKMAPRLPSTLRLQSEELKITGWTTKGLWTGQTTYNEIMEQTNASSSLSRIRLRFASPTAFRSQQINNPFPLPDYVWKSLFWKWILFAPDTLQINPKWPEFAANCITVTEFDIHSEKINLRGNKGILFGGCVGDATYHLLPEKECGEFSSFWHNAEQVLKLLAEFSMFSGVGHHTTMGLGQTLWIK